MRRVIGLTGGFASGKSTVSAHLRDRGVYVCDADAVSRSLLEVGGGAYDAVKSAFPEYIKEDGSVDRAALGAHVFSDEDALKLLNGITHPEILKAIEKDIRDKEGIVIIDAPLLIETGLNKLCDEIWLVRAEEEARIERAVKRSGISRKEAASRIKSQLPDSEKEKYSDKILDNSSDVAALLAAADAALEEAFYGRG